MINANLEPEEMKILIDAMTIQLAGMARKHAPGSSMKVYNERITVLEDLMLSNPPLPIVIVYIDRGAVQRVEKQGFAGDIVIEDNDDREATPPGETYEPAVW